MGSFVTLAAAGVALESSLTNLDDALIIDEDGSAIQQAMLQAERFKEYKALDNLDRSARRSTKTDLHLPAPR